MEMKDEFLFKTHMLDKNGEKTGVDVPTHRMIVNMVHAMEDRDRKEMK